MSDAQDSDDEVEPEWIQCPGLDAGGGSESLELGADWVAYLSQIELPGNVSGVDYSIEDFIEEGSADV